MSNLKVVGVLSLAAIIAPFWIIYALILLCFAIGTLIYLSFAYELPTDEVELEKFMTTF